MPYLNEYASKIGHVDFLKGHYEDFLKKCSFEDQRPLDFSKFYISVARKKNEFRKIFAIDGGYHVVDLHCKRKSQIGNIKISCIELDVERYEKLKDEKGPTTIDELNVFEVKNILLSLPGPNIVYNGMSTPIESFRFALWEFVRDKVFYNFHLLDTFQEIFKIITVPFCPSCSANILLKLHGEQGKCGECQKPVYPTDALRLFDHLRSCANMATLVSQTTQFLEHLISAHIVKNIATPKDVVIRDGPLALFGPTSKASSRFQNFFFDKRKNCLFFGVQKTGKLVDHAEDIKDYFDEDMAALVDAKYLSLLENVENEDFGYETYYGQDFICITSARFFVFGLPFCFAEKGTRGEFRDVKPEDYLEYVEKVFYIFRNFNFALYGNALYPVSMAHQAASISPFPADDLFCKICMD